MDGNEYMCLVHNLTPVFDHYVSVTRVSAAVGLAAAPSETTNSGDAPAALVQLAAASSPVLAAQPVAPAPSTSVAKPSAAIARPTTGGKTVKGDSGSKKRQ